MSNVSVPTEPLKAISRLPPELRAMVLSDTVVLDIAVHRNCKGGVHWCLIPPAQILDAGKEILQMWHDHLVAVRHPLRIDMCLPEFSHDTFKKVKRCCKRAETMHSWRLTREQDLYTAPTVGLELKFKKGPIEQLRIYVSADSIRRLVEIAWLPAVKRDLERIHRELQAPAMRKEKTKVAFVMVFGQSDIQFSEFLFDNCLAFRRAARMAKTWDIIEIDFVGFTASIIIAEGYRLYRPRVAHTAEGVAKYRSKYRSFLRWSMFDTLNPSLI